MEIEAKDLKQKDQKVEINTPESAIKRIVVDNEYETSKSNRSERDALVERLISIFNCQRPDKDYSWKSNIHLPEMQSHILTQVASDITRYHSTREYTDVFLDDTAEEAKLAADATKECLNRTLNRKRLYFFPKHARARMLNMMFGRTYALCYWEKEFSVLPDAYKKRGKLAKKKSRKTVKEVETDNGFELFDQEELLIKDGFNFELIDERNVFHGNEYHYNLQDMPYVIYRVEKSLNELLAESKSSGYINMDKLKYTKVENTDSGGLETETSQETFNLDASDAKVTVTPESKKYDVLVRLGKFWMKVTKWDINGYALEAEYGYDNEGKLKDDAEYIESILVFAIPADGGEAVLIMHKPQTHRDWRGVPYRNIIRGMQYLHPSEDGGVGDGFFLKEQQKALDDLSNLTMDRVTLATMPMFKSRKYSFEDDTDIELRPGGNTKLENIDDLQEIQISDNTSGADNFRAEIRGMMQQVDSINQVDMGQNPSKASTTATAVSQATANSANRGLFKSMSFDNTFLSEMYWMIIQMTLQFAEDETMIELMGDKYKDFDPSYEYTFKPITSSLETTYSKQAKINNMSQIIQMLVIRPDYTHVSDYFLKQIAKLMGDEYDISAIIRQLPPPEPQNTAIPAGGATGGMGPSNQNGVMQGEAEMMARQGAMGV